MVSAPFNHERRPFIVLFQEAAGAGVDAWPGQADDGTLITGLAPSRDAPAGEPAPLAKGCVSCGTDTEHVETGYPADPARFALDDEMLENFAHAVAACAMRYLAADGSAEMDPAGAMWIGGDRIRRCCGGAEDDRRLTSQRASSRTQPMATAAPHKATTMAGARRTRASGSKVVE